MAVKMLNVPSLPNIPWQEKPADYKLSSPVWRYSENPVMGRNPTPEIARIFNSAVVPWEDGYIAVLRGEQVNGIPYVYLGHSKDGIHWDVEREKVPFVDDNGNPKMPHYAYDPRLVKVDDTYYIIWCTDFYGAAIGMAKTKDFKTFTRIENPFIPFNRNAVLFPRKVNGKFKLLSRPSDSGHTPFGDIFISESPDMEYWGHHRHVMGRGSNWWESVKIGGGTGSAQKNAGGVQAEPDLDCADQRRAGKQYFRHPRDQGVHQSGKGRGKIRGGDPLLYQGALRSIPRHGTVPLYNLLYHRCV